MADRVVTLREERFDRSSYFLRARMREDGDVVIEGQDLGATAEGFWGSDEYEWTITVRKQALPALIVALGGVPGVDDALELLATRFRENEHVGTRGFLEESGVPFEFWNRVGD